MDGRSNVAVPLTGRQASSTSGLTFETARSIVWLQQIFTNPSVNKDRSEGYQLESQVTQIFLISRTSLNSKGFLRRYLVW